MQISGPRQCGLGKRVISNLSVFTQAVVGKDFPVVVNDEEILRVVILAADNFFNKVV